MKTISAEKIQWQKGDRIIVDYGSQSGIWIATVTMVRQKKVHYIFDYEAVEKDSCHITSTQILAKGVDRKRTTAIPPEQLKDYVDTTIQDTKGKKNSPTPLPKEKAAVAPEELVILDFETTGLSAPYDRIIEVGAVIVHGNQVVKKFSQLMNPGGRIPYFITELTGISNSMVKNKPSPTTIMPKLKKFLGNRTILAHNASFDAGFLSCEMERANLSVENPFLCTMLLSRRLIPEAYNHKLPTLANHLQLTQGRSHRALDDVMVTTQLWNHLYELVAQRIGSSNVPISVFHTITKRSKNSISAYLNKVGANS